jgi:phosphatidylserine/phosphatidylglycerophosphate/cardiolipin synthase-like enzyme
VINEHRPGKFTFYSSAEYRATLLDCIKQAKAGSRLLVTTMSFNPSEPPVGKIMQALASAAERKVKTTLIVDAHVFLIKRNMLSNSPGPLWYAKKLPKRLRQPYECRLRTLQQLNKQPEGEYAIVNSPTRRFSLPVAGRSHIKLVIVDDVIFLGGCNLQGTKFIDMMVSWRDKPLADWLYVLFTKVKNDKHVLLTLNGQDISKKVDDDTTLLIDAGLRNQSIILRSAIELIDAAQEWILMTCQWFPNSVTAEALKRAHQRGVKVELIFSHPSMHGPIGIVVGRANILRQRLRIPADLFEGMIAKENTMLHAKLLATDAGTMLGSHNYVRTGVSLGTAEIALLGRSPEFTNGALAAFERARTT